MTENMNAEEIRGIYQKLKDFYGEAPKPDDKSGVEYLVETILSQNTNDVNRDKAYQNLQDRYDSWKEVEKGDVDELTETIRVAGLGPTKANRIQNALRIVREETGGKYSLDFIRDMSVEEAKDWLENIPGIGPKTAAIILCFHFKKPVIPVDTHVHRISKRLGIIPKDASRKKAHKILDEKVPDDIKYGFHRLLITHGREHCKARNPTCGEGPLAERCIYWQEVVQKGRDEEEVFG